ncbi:MAG: glycoside hydrolase family 16 protein [Planctomycetaceae bacterium]|jgi:hypothetical protein|nr:glycoside hydrolase family 16 protein [Planctomycetaceae bacterium]
MTKQLLLLVLFCFSSVLVIVSGFSVAEDVKPLELITTVLPLKIVPDRVPLGARIKITYRFEAEKPYPNDNSVFVHIIDESGKMVAQADHLPGIATGSPGWIGNIEYTTDYIIPQKYGNTVPNGKYRLVIGLYHADENKKWINEPLQTGVGVLYDQSRTRCIAGSFIVDPTAPMPPSDTEKTPTLDLTGSQIVFEEDFSQPLDVSPWGPGTRWIAHTPWTGDFGEARFMDPQSDFPFTIHNNVLRIEARKSEEFAAKDQWKRLWASGLLASCDPKGGGFALQYGYFVARMKMPVGQGVWPAFWLASAYDRTNKTAGADGSVELDVVEYYGHFPNSYRTAQHVWEPKPHQGAGMTITTKPNEPSLGFHDYGVMVKKDFIVYYFDGIEIWKQPTPPEHNKPLMLLVNLALGSGYSIAETPNPSFLDIKFIRAYSLP